jgi:hypothetical protein
LWRTGEKVADELREPLTGREMTVRHRLPTMDSNTEIADDRRCSPTRSRPTSNPLCCKLDVPGRRAAVHRAAAPSA